mgnify:CR=1 FL=1
MNVKTRPTAHDAPAPATGERAAPPPRGGASPVQVRGLLTGFALSLILTALAFWLVMAEVFAQPGVTVTLILALALVQIAVHMVFFLHLDTRSEGGWNLLALLFTAVLVLILLVGSLWVMYHLDHHLMPPLTPAPRA